MNFWQITKSKNVKWGTLIKRLKSMFPTLLKLCKVKGNQKINMWPKFEVSNFKNKKSGQQFTFQKIWKILLSLQK